MHRRRTNAMFDSELLKTFVAVAESGGFTRAAARLHSTQSTVSAQIQRLETEAGQPLFARSTRSVCLTPAGELLLGYAHTILRLNEDARRRLSGSGQIGPLRIGVAEDLAGWVCQRLKAFRARYADLEVAIDIGIGTSLFRRLESQALDLAIGGVCADHYSGRKLWQEPLVWAFASVGAVPDPLPLAVFPEPCPYRDAALRGLAAAQRRWHIACTSSSLAGVRAAAMAGIAVTPLPRHALLPGLRIVGKKERLPELPRVDFVLQTNQTDTRDMVAAFSGYCEQASRHGRNGHRAERVRR
jgi:DNA-binding transcriptional LysR family regulator